MPATRPTIGKLLSYRAFKLILLLSAICCTYILLFTTYSSRTVVSQLQQNTVNSAAPRKKEYLVSVVIPVYNQLEYLPQAIASLLSQTYTNLEIVLVNDGSTELYCESTLQDIKLKDKRIKVLNKKNGGLADARNAGISVSKGELILPLDADDTLEPTYIEKAVALMNEDPKTNLVIADLNGFYDKEPARNWNWPIPEWDPVDLLYKNKFHCSAVYKRHLWEIAGGYDPSLPFGWEDWDFWIRIVERTTLVPVRIKEKLFNYRLRAGAMHDYCKQNFQTCFALMQTLHPFSYPYEEILQAHVLIQDAGMDIFEKVADRINKFPNLPGPHLWKALYTFKHQPRKAVKNLMEALSSSRALNYTVRRDEEKHLDWQPYRILSVIYDQHIKDTALKEEADFYLTHLFETIQFNGKDYIAMKEPLFQFNFPPHKQDM